MNSNTDNIQIASESPESGDTGDTKEVLVIMPFGLDNKVHIRNVIEFLRIKYIIEKRIFVTEKYDSKTRKVLFKASVCKVGGGNIPSAVVGRIAKADVVVALITELNVNVIYELALRNVFRAEFVLIVKGDPDDVLPIYFKEEGHIKWAPLHANNGGYDLAIQGKNIQKAIDILVNAQDKDVNDQDKDQDKSSELSFHSNIDEIPDVFKKAIEENDAELIRELQTHFQKIVSLPPPEHLEFLREYIGNFEPGRILSNWQTYVPYAVVKIRWKQANNNGTYLEGNMIGCPVVSYANSLYLNIVNLASLPDVNSAPLTHEYLLALIEPLVNADDYKDFNEDQKRVFKDIVFQNRASSPARVPLIFNQTHQVPSFHNKSFMPVLASLDTVGDVRHPHNMFIVLMLIEGPWKKPNSEQKEEMSS